MPELAVTFVAAVNEHTVLQNNLLRSPGLHERTNIQWLFKEGFASAPAAYNQALDEAVHDVVAFVHQDVYLPEPWLGQLASSINLLEKQSFKWGVLGSFGSRPDLPGGVGYVFTTGLGRHGNAIAVPTPVETLDEIVLIVRKSSGLRFDKNLPHYHMYGVDLCLSARQQGLINYAIPAPCVHNTNQLLELPPEFYKCYSYIKRKWAADLPIAASCMSLTRFDSERWLKRIDELLARWIRPSRAPLLRVDDPSELLLAPTQSEGRSTPRPILSTDIESGKVSNYEHY